MPAQTRQQSRLNLPAPPTTPTAAGTGQPSAAAASTAAAAITAAGVSTTTFAGPSDQEVIDHVLQNVLGFAAGSGVERALKENAIDQLIDLWTMDPVDIRALRYRSANLVTTFQQV